MGKSKLPIVGLIILGILALFLVQNSSPPLSVTFLGIVSIPLPLGVWLLIPFLAGVLSAGIIALILPRLHRPQRQSSPPTSGAPRATPREPRPNRESSTSAVEPSWVDEGLEETPGKTNVSGDRVRTERTNSTSDESRAEFQVGEPEQEVWDEEDWNDEDWPEEENSVGVRVGEYEIQKKPVSAYREGTLYSYSYSESALTEKSNDTVDDTIDETIEESPDSGELDSEPEPQVAETQDEVPKLPESEERAEAEETAIEASEVMAVSEVEPETEETIEAEFLDDSEESETSQNAKGLFGSKLFNFKAKASQSDDWMEPPTAPKDW